MKLTPLFLFLFLLLHIPISYLAAQDRDSASKKITRFHRAIKVPKPTYNKIDTTPKRSVPGEPLPGKNNDNNLNNHNNDNNDKNDKDDKNDNKHRYEPPDTIRPVPVETHTYIRNVLRSEKIYLNKDALELIQILNPRLANMSTVMSNYKLVLPEFPEPDSRTNKSVNQEFKQDLDPDGNANNIFTGMALRLDTLINTFNATGFELNDATDQRNYSLIKSLLPALADLNERAINKIKHTSRRTVNTLTMETRALNNVLSKCNNTSTLSGEDIGKIYSLITDMNILLAGITDRKLQIPSAWDHSYYHNKGFNYSLASYNISNNDKDYKSTLSDDDPRKFNIYIFRRSLVENGKQNPEMEMYEVSYAIPALASDTEGWEKIPALASTLHCYFPPARFKFTVTDTRSGQVYSATEDLYDAQKDPNEKWTVMNLIDRHPTYRLIFLLP